MENENKENETVSKRPNSSCSRPVYRPPNRMRNSPVILKSRKTDKRVSFSQDQGKKLEAALERSKKILARHGDEKEEVDEEEAIDEEETRVQRPAPLPSWNLNAERLRTLARINQFQVDVKKLVFKAEMIDAVHDYNSEAFVAKTKNVGRKRPLEATRALSYFVAYSVPPETASQSFCSSKKGTKPSKTVHYFDSANSVHQVR